MLALDHAGQEAPGQIHRRPRVEVDHGELPIDGQLGEPPGEPGAGVVDEHVQFHAAPGDFGLQHRARIRTGEIESDHVGSAGSAELLGEPGQSLGAPGHEQERSAAAGEGPGERLPYSAGSARDEGPPLGQAQFASARSLAGAAAGAGTASARGGAAFCGERQLSKSATRCTQLTVQ